MRLLVTRPEADAVALTAKLEALGHEVVCEPLLEIHFRTDVALDLGDVAAVLVTSANGIRALARATSRRDLPVYAVGAASAAAARELGYDAVASAGGDVCALAALVVDECRPGAGVLLHPAGSVSAGDLTGALEARGFKVRRVTLYEARASTRFSDRTDATIRRHRIDGVLLYSPRTARTFMALVKEAGLEKSFATVTAFCLSEAVGSALEKDLFRRVCVAARPDEDSLLSLLDAA